jgi:hypothetical protein
MPRFDRTGPMGVGTMTGRRMGVCQVIENNKIGTFAGIGRRLGLGKKRGFGWRRTDITNEKEFLLAQKDIIETRLKNLKDN